MDKEQIAGAILASEKTLRDEFAMHALAAMLSRPSSQDAMPSPRLKKAQSAYAWADALIEARSE